MPNYLQIPDNLLNFVVFINSLFKYIQSIILSINLDGIYFYIRELINLFSCCVNMTKEDIIKALKQLKRFDISGDIEWGFYRESCEDGLYVSSDDIDMLIEQIEKGN